VICGNAAHRLGRWSRPAPEPAPTLAVTMPRRLRRLLATFLLLALAFQSVWAAAAPYCRHEVQRPGAASVFHIGHHSHVHHAAAGPLKAVDGQPTSPSSPATESGLVPSGDVGHARVPAPHCYCPRLTCPPANHWPSRVAVRPRICLRLRRSSQSGPTGPDRRPRPEPARSPSLKGLGEPAICGEVRQASPRVRAGRHGLPTGIPGLARQGFPVWP
jgi:hypothetical protein